MFRAQPAEPVVLPATGVEAHHILGLSQRHSIGARRTVLIAEADVNVGVVSLPGDQDELVAGQRRERVKRVQSCLSNEAVEGGAQRSVGSPAIRKRLARAGVGQR